MIRAELGPAPLKLQLLLQVECVVYISCLRLLRINREYDEQQQLQLERQPT